MEFPMKRLIFLMAFFLFISEMTHAANDPVKNGMQLYKKHRFEEAFFAIYPNLAAAGSNQKDETFLSLGMICLENAKLYHELYRLSVVTNLDYLTRLISDGSQSDSRYVHLYLGKSLLQTGKLMESAGFFDKFLNQEISAHADRQIAKIGLGTAFFLQEKRKEAEQCWNGIDTSDIRVNAAMAAAYTRVGLSNKETVTGFIHAVNGHSAADKDLQMQAVSDSIEVFTSAGIIDESFELLKNSDLRQFFHEETLATNKSIRFYDPALLENLSLLYFTAGLKYFQEVSRSSEKRIFIPAKYYLSEAYDRLGKADLVKQTVNEVITAGDLPKQLKSRLQARLAVAGYLQGDSAAAHKQLNELLKIKNDPGLITEILLLLCNHQIDFPPAVIAASSMAMVGEGTAFMNLNYSLGKYYLWKRDYVKAVSYMEAGRDKSNKNRVEYNSPLMLINLAEAYYRSKQFSEALEIFFEMSKHYPAVRQIQTAMQGVYSIEQKSAGDARIF